MAKTDKSNKKVASKKPDPIKQKPAVPATAKDILAKAAAVAKPAPKKVRPASVQKTADSSDKSSDTSSSEDSSSEDSDDDDDDEVASIPANTAPNKDKKTSDSEDGSSDASSSDESSSESESDEEDVKGSAPARTVSAGGTPANTALNNGKKTSDSEDDSSGTSSSDESSGESASASASESESESDEDVEMSAPAQTVPAEGIKKRKADSEAAATPKKVKLANDDTNAANSVEETKSIFVGRLSWNVDNDWLAEEFGECGEVESAHVQMDRNTGRSRGFGYVHFKTADAVQKALALNRKEIDGRAVNIDKSSFQDKKASAEKRAQAFGDKQSPPSSVLFIGNLSFGVNEDTLWETFGEHGDIKSVRVPTDRETGRPKGFAYVEFSEVEAAKNAHGALQGFELDGRAIRLDFSQPRDNAGGRGGGQGGRGGRGRGGFDRGGFDRGGFDRGGFDRGRGRGRGARGGDRGGRGRGRGGARTGGITQFEGQKTTFD